MKSTQLRYMASQEAITCCWEVERGSSEVIQPSWAQKFRTRLVLGERRVEEGGRPILTRALLFPGFYEEAPGFFSSIFSNQSFPYMYLDGRAFLDDQPSQFS